jgi:hypothetical protein
MVVEKKFLHLRKRHIYGLDQIGLEEEVSTALDRFLLQTEQWKKWSNRPLTGEVHDRIMEVMKYGQKATKEIEKKVTQEADKCDNTGFPVMTLWTFLNILTWYITHRAVSLNHRVELERRLRKALV